MGSSTRYITYVSHTLLPNEWRWTKPWSTPQQSVESAENMVSARLLKDRGESYDFKPFGRVLRREYPELVEESQQYIGETREIELPEGTKPKEFQRAFHEVQCTSESEEEMEDVETQEGDE